MALHTPGDGFAVLLPEGSYPNLTPMIRYRAKIDLCTRNLSPCCSRYAHPGSAAWADYCLQVSS
ncbi:MAG: hypothetical protein WAN99_00770 [Methanoculleus sp.]